MDEVDDFFFQPWMISCLTAAGTKFEFAKNTAHYCQFVSHGGDGPGHKRAVEKAHEGEEGGTDVEKGQEGGTDVNSFPIEAMRKTDRGRVWQAQVPLEGRVLGSFKQPPPCCCCTKNCHCCNQKTLFGLPL